ncbi:MAG: DUF305 domain-containing protein [Actinomycetota bacterium]|nr:DUF305 domain-containing protein [Actinomycetota bacterium]
MSILTTPGLATEPVAEPPRGPSRLVTVLLTVMAIAALVLSGAAGYVLGHRTNGSSMPDSNSVDAGFAWDMSVHHLQAVTMAGYARDHSTDPIVRTLAYDIETSQFNQVGQMQGWLDVWGLPPQNPNSQMAWMAASGHDHLSADGLMPGMATQAQVAKLETLTGKPLDIYFMQLMLHHHQGGLPMAQWAADHASTAYVRNAAQKMATAQSAEILSMEQLLRERGASPLPPPA